MKNPANQIAQLRDILTVLENSNTVQPLNELRRPGLAAKAIGYGKQFFGNLVKANVKNPVPAAATGWEGVKKFGRAVMGLAATYNVAQLLKDLDNNDTDAATAHGLNALLDVLGMKNLGLAVAVPTVTSLYKWWRGTPLTDEEKEWCDKMAQYYYKTLKRAPKPDDKEVIDLKFFKRISNTYKELEKEYGKVASDNPLDPSGAQAGPSGAEKPAASTTTTPAAVAPTTTTTSGPTDPSTAELKKNAGITAPTSPFDALRK